MNSNPNTTKPEVINPDRDLYPQVGLFVIDRLQDLFINNLQAFNETVASSLYIAILETNIDREIRSRRSEVDQDLILESLPPLLGLYVYSISTKESQTKLKEGVKFEDVIEIESTISSIASQLADSETGVTFWNHVLQSISRFQGLVSKKHRMFLQGPESTLKDYIKHNLLGQMSANTARRVKDLFSYNWKRPHENILSISAHHPIIEDTLIPDGLSSNNAYQILASVRMLKVLKKIEPDIKLLLNTYSDFSSSYSVTTLQEFQGKYNLKPEQVIDCDEINKIIVFMQFVLFTSPTSELHSPSKPYQIGPITLRSDGKYYDFLHITKSSVAWQIHNLQRLLEGIESVSQTQKKPTLKNGDQKFPFSNRKMANGVSKQTSELLGIETVPSRLNSYLTNYVKKQLARHNLDLSPITEFYFVNLAINTILQINDGFANDYESNHIMYLFSSDQDSFSQVTASNRFHLAQLEAKSNSVNSRKLISNTCLESFISNMDIVDPNLSESISFLSPNANLMIMLMEDKDIRAILKSFEAYIDPNLSLKDAYDAFVSVLESRLDIKFILQDLLMEFDPKHSYDTRSGALYNMTNLSANQLEQLYNLNPAAVLDSTLSCLAEDSEISELPILLTFLDIAHKKGDISMVNKNKAIKAIPKDIPTCLIPRIDLTPELLLDMQIKIKENAFYAFVTQMSQASNVTAEHVEAAAHILADLDLKKLKGNLVTAMLESNSFNNFFEQLCQLNHIKNCHKLAQDIVEIVFDKFSVHRYEYGLEDFISKLGDGFIKAIFLADNQLPTTINEKIKQRRLYFKPETHVELEDILIALTKNTSNTTHNAAIKTLFK